jgi:hypothetical protein
MGLEFSSPPISMTVAKPKLKACLSTLFASQLQRDLLLGEFDNLSVASDLAASIAQTSWGSDLVRFKYLPTYISHRLTIKRAAGSIFEEDYRSLFLLDA